jgi:hypothetical protein
MDLKRIEDRLTLNVWRIRTNVGIQVTGQPEALRATEHNLQVGIPSTIHRCEETGMIIRSFQKPTIDFSAPGTIYIRGTTTTLDDNIVWANTRTVQDACNAVSRLLQTIADYNGTFLNNNMQEPHCMSCFMIPEVYFYRAS